jgi:flagellar basal body P-ring protein FlgI
MKPLDADLQRLIDRRLFLAAGLASCWGCASPLFRGQTPELDSGDEKKLELVGDFARPWNMQWIKLESVALVTGLDNTGSDPPPGQQRDLLKGEMQSHEVKDADAILASPKTSLVLLRAYLPPGVQKGDPLDVEVSLPGRSETTSLRGGWLMLSRLRQMAPLGGAVRMGNVDGVAEGDVLVDALFEGKSDRVLETRGRVLGGGRSRTAREIGLALGKSDASIRMTTLIGKAINQRFFTIDAGVKKGVANPERDNYLGLSISPRYKHNLARYLRVVRNIAIRENPIERTARLQLLEKKLLEPTSCWLAAIQLEAIGTEAIVPLKQGLKSADPEVRFYSAEALAYLDQPEAAAPLAEAAKNEPAFRWHALAALATLTHVAGLDALSELLHVPSIETRYGAFRSLRLRNVNDPTTKGEVLAARFRYHVLASDAEPVIHLTRSRVPEIVLFGHEQKLKVPRELTMLKAGKNIMIAPLESGELRAGRYDTQETVYEVFSPEVDKLIRAIVKLGGGYSDVIECLQEAKQKGCLPGRLAVEAMPKANRKFYRDDDPLPEAPEGEEASSSQSSSPAPPAEAPLGQRRAASPAPEDFSDGISSEPASENRKEPRPPEEIDPKKPGFFDRLNPFSK